MIIMQEYTVALVNGYSCYSNRSKRCYMCLVGSCQCRLNSALESRGTSVLSGVIVLAVYVSQIND